MKIIQEKSSIDGRYRTNEILNVNKVSPRDNQILRNLPGSFDVIWCKTDITSYPIAFRNRILRDRALNYILLSTSETVVLDYETTFFERIIPDHQAKKFISTSLRNHLYIWLNKFLQEESVQSLMKRPAFSRLDASQIIGMSNKERISVDKDIAKIWCKTLFVPRPALKMGITPLQFYELLIDKNNE